jgi:predicted O-methyltransferase YrrM
MQTADILILAGQVALGAGLYMLWRRQGRMRAEMRSRIDALQRPGAAAPAQPVVERGEEDRRTVDAILTATQQIEWRAHLTHVLDWPFGALPATRHWVASPDLLVHLARAVLDRRPGVVVECGSGVSTLVIARALQLNGSGRVHALECVPPFAEMTRERIGRAGLSDLVEVVDAQLVPAGEGGPLWYDAPSVAALPDPIDLIFVDGPQSRDGASRAPVLDGLLPRLAPGGAVLFDDARRPDMEALRKQIRRRFPDWVQTRLPAEKGALLFVRPG